MPSKRFASLFCGTVIPDDDTTVNCDTLSEMVIIPAGVQIDRVLAQLL